MPNYLAFASANYAGICPEAWQAMVEANTGFAGSYGDAPFTERACNLLRETFETDCQVFFVFNGTAHAGFHPADFQSAYCLTDF